MENKTKNLEKIKDQVIQLFEEDNTRKPRIAAWGLVKAGKSSLLNMLAESVEEEYFQTGATRTTRANQEFECENLILIDTPGLGIDDDDSTQAIKGLEKADVILFVHAPIGELDKEEIDLLRFAKQTYGEHANERIVVVTTLMDKDQNGSLEKIHQKVQSQLQEILSLSPASFMVSSTRYGKGIREGKNTMVLSSKIPALREHLNLLSKNIIKSLEEVRRERKKSRALDLKENIEKLMEEELSHCIQIQKPLIEKIKSFNELFEKTKSNLKNQKKEIQNLKSKRKSI